MTTKTMVAVGAIVAIILGVFIAYGQIEHKAYIDAKAKAQLLDQEFGEYSKTAEAQKSALAIESANWRDAQEKALAAADTAKKQTAIIQAVLDAEKARTKTLTPDALAGSINLRIGADQCLPIAAGTFTLTRYGAESALNLFIDGEGWAAKYRGECQVSDSLRTATEASQAETATFSQRLSLTNAELAKCAVWGAAEKDARVHLERSLFGMRIKHYLVGAGVGAAIVFVLHLAGTI